MAGELSSGGCQFLSKHHLSCITTELGVTATVTMYHVQPGHIGPWWNSIFIDTEAAWVREVRTEVGQALKDIPSFSIGNRDLGLERRVGYVRYSNERRYVGLSKVRRIAGLCGPCLL